MIQSQLELWKKSSQKCNSEFPALSRSTMKRLLDELRNNGRIYTHGRPRYVRWFPKDGIGPENDDTDES
jgi:hypothetical protein